MLTSCLVCSVETEPTSTYHFLGNTFYVIDQGKSLLCYLAANSFLWKPQIHVKLNDIVTICNVAHSVRYATHNKYYNN